MTPVEVAPLNLPAPEPMLQLTPELEESFEMLAVKAFVSPLLREAVVGLMLTAIAGGGFDEEPEEFPDPQPARNAKDAIPQKTTPSPERTDVFLKVCPHNIVNLMLEGPYSAGGTLSMTHIG